MHMTTRQSSSVIDRDRTPSNLGTVFAGLTAITVITVIGVRIKRPSTMKIHPMPNPMVNSIRNAKTTPTIPAPGR